MNRLIQQFGSSTEKIQLICFPFAGGYSASFRPLHAILKDYCNFLVFEPPGHGTNRDPLVDNLEQLVNLYFQTLLPNLDKPFVLFGHSMGGMIVYRMAQKLEQAGIFPQAIILSAIQPPHIKRTTVTDLNDEAFFDHVIRMGGVPSELVNMRGAIEFFLPIFRADFKALETFQFTDQTILRTPVHIFNGDEDITCLNEACGWKQWAHHIRFYTFQGGHMFLLSETDKVTKTIQMILTLE